MARRRKLIEVGLPLEGINREAAREKEPFTRRHPRSLHIWWARRPLVACRAVLFASLIDDPDQEGVPETLLQQIDQLPSPSSGSVGWSDLPLGIQRRRKLFAFIERLARWDHSSSRDTLAAARLLIHAATGGNPPPFLDPFCGGGSLPLEAQRLGLAATGSDLNPVAALITRALIEIPPMHRSIGPVNPPDRRQESGSSSGNAAGLAADIRHYGRWLRDEAESRIGHLYPKVPLPEQHGGGEAPVIGWLWARTVRCPNPECAGVMPLIRSFRLAAKGGRAAWIDPRIHAQSTRVRFEIRTGEGTPPEGTVGRRGARCLLCGSPVPLRYLRQQGQANRMEQQLMAVVVGNRRGRIYLPPAEATVPVLSAEEQTLVRKAREDFLSGPTPQHLTGGTCYGYGLTSWGSLFTPRQIIALSTLGDLVGETRDHVYSDALATGLEAQAASCYADAVATYLALSLSRWMDLSNTLTSWNSTNQNVRGLFARHALPMAWDFVELSPFGSLASLTSFFQSCSEIVEDQGMAPLPGLALQRDATTSASNLRGALVVTDPPYYDNIAYAQLSDFFYGWLRHCLGQTYPDLFGESATLKDQELVVAPYRLDGNRGEAGGAFEHGLKGAFARMLETRHPDYPLVLFYAVKRTELQDGTGAELGERSAMVSPGWEAMLRPLIGAGFAITAAWPMRCERRTRSVALAANALDSCMVLACRPRPTTAPAATQEEFLAELKDRLLAVVKALRRHEIAPVDLAQVAIGPTMVLFTRFSQVIGMDGNQLSVHTALACSSRVLDELLSEAEADWDAETRWALSWFERHAFAEGPLAMAEVEAEARGSTVGTLVEARIAAVRAGRVRLLRGEELAPDEALGPGRRGAIWRATQCLVHTFESQDEAASVRPLLAALGDLAETVSDLIYRLYSICERKHRAREALSYNRLAVACQEMAQTRLSATP